MVSLIVGQTGFTVPLITFCIETLLNSVLNSYFVRRDHCGDALSVTCCYKQLDLIYIQHCFELGLWFSVFLFPFFILAVGIGTLTNQRPFYHRALLRKQSSFPSLDFDVFSTWSLSRLLGSPLNSLNVIIVAEGISIGTFNFSFRIHKLRT